MSWERYIENTKDSLPRALLLEGLSHVEHTGRALDLGAGALNETRALLAAGFGWVDAVDSCMLSQSLAEKLPESGHRLHFHLASFEGYAFEESSYDLISAQFALPFLDIASFGMVWERLEESIAKGGIFTGHLFGREDSWNRAGESRMTFHTETQVRELFEGPRWSLIACEQGREDTFTAAGAPRHAHVFSIIARCVR